MKTIDLVGAVSIGAIAHLNGASLLVSFIIGGVIFVLLAARPSL